MITTTDDKGNEALRGGMMKTRELQGITNHFDVKSVQEYSAKVEKFGGKVITPKTPVPGVGYFAMCADTENNAFGIFEADQTAK
jgi:predicted enzyme related to lactoylglutathione lyase